MRTETLSIALLADNLATVTQAIAQADVVQNEALKAHMLCLMRSTAQLDDGVTDAESVALATASMCAGSLNIYIVEKTRGMDITVASPVRRGIEDAEPGVAISMVLQERARRRNVRP